MFCGIVVFITARKIVSETCFYSALDKNLFVSIKCLGL